MKTQHMLQFIRGMLVIIVDNLLFNANYIFIISYFFSNQNNINKYKNMNGNQGQTFEIVDEHWISQKINW